MTTAPNRNPVQLVRRIPTVEWHCHLEGAARIATVEDLAPRYAVVRPAGG